VLAISLPVDNVAPSSSAISLDRSRMTARLLLLVLGGLLLAGNMGLAPWLSWNLFCRRTKIRARRKLRWRPRRARSVRAELTVAGQPKNSSIP
jgi:hypothetical protein